MIWLAAHVVGYTAFGWRVLKCVPKFTAWRRSRSKTAMLIRITRLEHELGIGIDWALDRIDTFAPVLSRPQHAHYKTLHDSAFRCYGCAKEVIYADYNNTPQRVRDSRHLLCDSCLPQEAAA